MAAKDIGRDCSRLQLTPGLQTALNHRVFENYRVFRGDTRILTDAEAAQAAGRSATSARANATTSVTVAQLEQTIAGSRALPDARLADQLSVLELTQRLRPATLARPQSALPGPQSQQNLDAGYPLITASIAVQYGPVDIGGKTYICPIRDEAIAQRHETQNREGTIPSTAISQGPILTRLNEVTFTQYHIYRGESRMLTDAEVAQMTGQPAESAPPGAPATTNPVSNPPPPPGAAAPAPSQPAAAASSPPQPAPENTANSATTANIPVFGATARQVLVDVAVDKRNGDPLGGISSNPSDRSL